MWKYIGINGCRSSDKKPVAGISTGLVTDKNNPEKYIMLTDIQGIEDFSEIWTLKWVEQKME